MSAVTFTQNELAAAWQRGVQQCVLIGSQPPLSEVLSSSSHPDLQMFAVAEGQLSNETLAASLENSDFDKLKASVFVWLGGAGHSTIDAVLSSLSFIASLPRGSGVVFDYVVERTSVASLTRTALDALSSRLALAGGTVKYLIQPQAVAAMLRELGFCQILDLAQEEQLHTGGHLVSAVV